MRRGFVLLLVEDDPVLGPLTAEALEVFGHATTHVATSEAAMHALRCNDAFDAIVLDLDLGNARGETLITNMRGSQMRMPEIVILSALPLHALQRAQRETNACGAIQKPISVEDLAQELERCIPLR